MPLTVATIVNNARDLHPALSVANAPLPVAFRALTRFEGDIVRDITARVPGFLAGQLTVLFPLAVFTNGVNLATLIPNGWLDLTDAFLTYAASPTRTRRSRFIPWEQRDMPGERPAHTLRNDVLYFLGEESLYASFSSFILTYTPAPAALTTEQSFTILPDDALDCLSAMLAAFWLMRMVGNPAFDVTAGTAGVYDNKAAAARRDFLTRVFRVTQRQTYRVRDAAPGGGF